MANIVEVAEKLNFEVTRLNNERSKMEGMLESSKSSFEKAVKAYEAKYGVKLTEDMLQKEYNDVYAHTKGAIMDLQEKIEGIERGDYKADVESVEYDMEPDAAPIREEKPEKKKRGRKKKTEDKVEEKVEPKVEVEVEDIDAPTSTEEVKPKEVKVEEVKPTEEVPFNMNFSGFPDMNEMQVPMAEEKPEPKVIPKAEPKKERKTLSAADLSALVGESAKQNPPKIEGMPTSDDDVVDVSSFGSKPAVGVEPTVAAEPKTENTFGDFSGFAGFGGFGAPETKSEEVKPEFNFGGFGAVEDIDNTPTQKEEPKKEEPKSETPSGWGDFGNFPDFGSLMNSSDFKI